MMIPISFVFIRMWGTIRFFIGLQLLSVHSNDTAGKDKIQQQIDFPFLVNMQVSCVFNMQWSLSEGSHLWASCA